MNVVDVLQFPPILRGAVVLVVAGTVFPLVGVFVLRLNLITLRFALMHSALLGSAVALAAGTNPLIAGLIANTALVTVVATVGSRPGGNAGHTTTFFMVFTIGLAFAVLYRFDVPARESLGLLWGNIFALTPTDAWITTASAAVVVGAIVLMFSRITAVLYDKDIAFSSGVNAKVVYSAILFMVGFTITLVMSLIGALLLDALLILPALIASFHAKSTRSLFVTASIWGFLISVGGFTLAIEIDIPASSGVTLLGAAILGVLAGGRSLFGRLAPPSISPETETAQTALQKTF